MPNNTQSFTLKAGESFTLPAGAELVYVSDSNSVTSDCTTIPESNLICYQFAWQHTDTGNLDDANFTKLILASGDEFDVTGDTPYNTTDADSKLFEWVNITFNRPEIIEAVCSDDPDDTAILKVRIPEAFGIPTFEITNPTDIGTVKMYIIGTVSDDCEDCTQLD